MSLEEIAKKMCAKGKGILAADESTGTMDKRLTSVGVECTDKNRLNFRENLFTADAMKNYIGGVILFDTTIREKTSLGISVPELIEKNNYIEIYYSKFFLLSISINNKSFFFRQQLCYQMQLY